MNKTAASNLIPTNIITGFLGVGKTTVIKHLLGQKPSDERWAVLVNEFGEVGIDSNLFSEALSELKGVTISQVPGGCMCCANGLPMQMSLNLLLAKSKPHRLLIEPTGLGHPKEVLAILTGEYYRDVLELQATLTLVDARKVSDSSYTSNTTYNEQVEIAEIVVASKADLYEPGDFPKLLDFLENSSGLDDKLVYQVQEGAVSLEWLDQPASQKNLHTYAETAIKATPSALPKSLETPEQGYVRADNSGEGFFSRGWIFNPHWKFDSEKLFSVVHEANVDRLKAVFLLPDAAIAFNKVDNVVSQQKLGEYHDSRIEIISRKQETLDGFEEDLLNCLMEPESVAISTLDSESEI